MNSFNLSILKNLYIAPPNSHKGQNGKVLVVGGSKLFHAASLWALSIASKIVDMVFYSSVPENNEIVSRIKNEFRNGIVVPRSDLEHYAREADCILVGPGLERRSKIKDKSRLNLDQKAKMRIGDQKFKNIDALESEEQTYWLTKMLLEKFPEKRFVLDAGSLQMMQKEWLLGLKTTPILTPHMGEFETLFNSVIAGSKVIPPGRWPAEAERKRRFRETSTFGVPGLQQVGRGTSNDVFKMSKDYHCVILLKGQEDIVCGPIGGCVSVKGGNAGMTKGGTGDVLAGLTAALYSRNSDPFLVARAASFFNKKAGDKLFKKMGLYFNASDLVDEIPVVMNNYLLKH